MAAEFIEPARLAPERRFDDDPFADAPISHAWAGLYEVTPDANPIIGPAREVTGLFLINGFSGHGFQHSPAAGRILADLIIGCDPGLDITPFAFERFAVGASTGEGYVV